MKSVDLHGSDLLDMMQSVERGVIPSSSKVIPLFCNHPFFESFIPQIYQHILAPQYPLVEGRA